MSQYSFFHGLNPASKHSGTNRYEFRDDTYEERMDLTVSEVILKAIHEDQGFFAGLADTYNIIVGNHFIFTDLIDTDNPYETSKGLLDYLIFPLAERKLIMNLIMHGRSCLATTAALLFVGAPVELIRFTIGAALTLLLVPVVMAASLIKCCIPANKEENTYIYKPTSLSL